MTPATPKALVNIAHKPKVNLPAAHFHLNAFALQTEWPRRRGLGGWVLRRGHLGGTSPEQPATFGASRSHPVFRRCPVLLTFPIAIGRIGVRAELTESDIWAGQR
jgi:hypothetical protein